MECLYSTTIAYFYVFVHFSENRYIKRSLKSDLDIMTIMQFWVMILYYNKNLTI